MSNTINTNHTPTILDTPVPAVTSTTGTTGTSASNSKAATGLGTTFLSLLVKELQNQDPTAPMDSTAMVGQMISLNQLDQLISINQTIGGSSSKPTGAAQASAVTRTVTSTPAAADSSATAVGLGQLPFDLNTMMPLASGSTAASAHSPLNAASI